LTSLTISGCGKGRIGVSLYSIYLDSVEYEQWVDSDFTLNPRHR